MRDMGDIAVLLVFSYLIVPAFVFVHVVAWDLVTGSDNISATTNDRVIATVFVILFWGLITYSVLRSALKTRRKPLQRQPTFIVTYVPEKRRDTVE